MYKVIFLDSGSALVVAVGLSYAEALKLVQRQICPNLYRIVLDKQEERPDSLKNI